MCDFDEAMEILVKNIDIFNKCLPLINKGGIFCMEMRKKNTRDSNFRKKVYGNTQVVFWENN